MRMFLSVLLLLATCGLLRAEDGLVLTTGRLQSSNTGFALQVVSVENRTDKSFELIVVECGFYSRNNLVGSGQGGVENVQPGTIAHGNIIAMSGAPGADNAKCRVVDARTPR